MFSLIILIAQLSSILTTEPTLEYSCDVLLPEANVYCISRTEFTLHPQNSATVTKFSCPGGLLCANVATVCSVIGPPACKRSRSCNTCTLNTIAACINDNQYVFCKDGKLDTDVRSCPKTKPYCSMEYITDEQIATVCTNRYQDIACNEQFPTDPLPITTTPSMSTVDPIPPKDKCITPGKFKESNDATCKTYYYCFYNEKGELEKRELECPPQTVYASLKGKCVMESSNFKCQI